MVEGKACSNLGIFDADAAKVGKDMVMSPGALWWGDYLFRQTWKIHAGHDDRRRSADLGGRVAALHRQRGRRPVGRLQPHHAASSSRTRLKFATFVATDPTWQVELTTGLPATVRCRTSGSRSRSRRSTSRTTTRPFAGVQGCDEVRAR